MVQSSESSSKEVSIGKKRKIHRKPYYIRVNSMPRILKRDIRRDYGTMLTNVVNSGDYDLVKQFYTQFFSPNLQSVTRETPYNDFNPLVKMSFCVDHTIHDILRTYQTLPDIVFQLENAQIIRKKHERGSIVKLSFQIKVTPLFAQELPIDIQLTEKEKDIHRNMIHYYGHGEHLETAWVEKNIDTFCMPSSSASSTTSLETVEFIDHTAGRRLQLEPCLVCQGICAKCIEAPQGVAVPLELQIYLDEQHRAYRIESNSR